MNSNDFVTLLGFVSWIPSDWSLVELPGAVVLYVGNILVLTLIAYQLVNQASKNVNRLYTAQSLQKNITGQMLNMYDLHERFIVVGSPLKRRLNVLSTILFTATSFSFTYSYTQVFPM